MKALLVVAFVGCIPFGCIPPAAVPVDWRDMPVQRVSAVTVKNTVPFTIELLASMAKDSSPSEHVVFGPAGKGVAEAPTIFIDDASPETVDEFAAGLPEDGTKIIQRATVPAGWWVALEKPSHVIKGDGTPSYSYWIHAQLGALTCEGFAYGYKDQLLRVAEMCVSLRP